ncbi:MAG: septum site-determining protein MinC [Candidatus Sericytochromatia bacterium]|nr:septum site-determining protein MinC [Candidatus Sericytochromatia bacterium]
MMKRQRKASPAVTVEHEPAAQAGEVVASERAALPSPEAKEAGKEGGRVDDVLLAAEQATALLRLKGWRGGLLLHLDASAPWSEVTTALHDKLGAVRDFWAGATCTLDLGERAECPTDLHGVVASLAERYGLNVVGVASVHEGVREAITLAGLEAMAELEPPIVQPPAQPPVVPQADLQPRYVKGTVRSGQVMIAEGHLVIMGDVNAGAEVRAGGDILVFGTLRGMAHAGMSGDRGAVIVALNLRPTQLRIADLIARAPDDGQPPLSKNPERAEVRGQEIHVVSM